MRKWIAIGIIVLAAAAARAQPGGDAPSTAPATAPGLPLPPVKVYPPPAAGAMTVGQLAQRWKDPRLVQRLSAVDFVTRLETLEVDRPARTTMLEWFAQTESPMSDSPPRKWFGSADSAEPHWALLEVGPGAENVDRLVALLPDPARNPRLAARLLEAAAPASVEATAALLAAKEWYPRWAGALALGVMGPRAARAEAALQARLGDAAEEPIVRAAAARALARIRGKKVAELIAPWPDLPGKIVADVRKKSGESKRAACERLADLQPPPRWLGAGWALACLYLNRNVESANRMLAETAPSLREGEAGQHMLPYMAPTYARILAMFRARAKAFPGRLSGPAEKALKEMLWAWLHRRAGAAASFRPARAMAGDAGQAEHLEVIACSATLLALQVFRDEPEYKDRTLKDGLSLDDHYAARAAWWIEWTRFRAMHGLWAELGASYSKHTFSSLANLVDLAEDPALRQRARMLLDVALVEEEQVSLHGVRCGHRAAVLDGGELNELDWYKQPLYGEGGGGLFHRIIETGPYEAPEAAILLHCLGADEPAEIRNHHLGRLVTPPPNTRGLHLADRPWCVFYAWRTPRYVLGSRMLESDAQCWSGMRFASLRSVAMPAFTGPKLHFQHRNVMFAQATQKQGMRIDFSPGLGLIETGGWIFADDGDAFLAVRAGEVEWDELHLKCRPKDPQGVVIFHAGDAGEHGSFDRFVRSVLSAPLTIEPVADAGQPGAYRVEYRPPGSPKLEFLTHLPSMADGKELDLDPPKTYSSPFLQCDNGSDKVTLRFGPRSWTYDFESGKVGD